MLVELKRDIVSYRLDANDICNFIRIDFTESSGKVQVNTTRKEESKLWKELEYQKPNYTYNH